MIQIPEQVIEARESYLRAYRRMLAERRGKTGGVEVEMLVLVAGAEEYAEHFRMVRPDAMWRGKDGGPEILCVEGEETFEGPVQVEVNGVAVVIHDVPWGDCPVSFSHPAFAWEGLVEWLTLWIDRHGQFPADGDGLHGVIHSVSPPETRGSRHYLHIDFGSAPVKALGELVELLVKEGATRIAIGQPVAV